MIELYAILEGRLPNYSTMMLMNKGVSFAMISVLIWMIHLNLSNPVAPYGRFLSVTYAGVSLTMVLIMLSRDSQTLGQFFPMFLFFGRLWFLSLLIGHALRFIRQYTSGTTV